MTAKIMGAWLDFNGQRAVVRTRCDPPQGGGGGWASTVFVPPQTILDLDALPDGIDLRGDARPSIYIDYEQVGADTGLLGATIDLRRRGSTPTAHQVWRIGDIRPGVLP